MIDLLLKVTAAMTEPHRYYHTMNHLSEMFMQAQERGIELEETQIHAIWMHDVVYRIPARSNESNEVASAAIANKWLSEAGYPESHIYRVERIILDTEKELPSIEESKVVIDLDLAGLALNYWENRCLIKAEFSHLSDEEFRRGRMKWLEHMLARPYVFVSDLFKDLESRAQGNMVEDLKNMEREENEQQDR